MNKKILFVIALGWILVGCADHMLASGGGGIVGPACPPQPSKPCKGDPQAPSVNLNTKNGQLQAKPYCVNASRGTALTFHLTPTNNKPKNVVTIAPKDANDTWLNGTNSTFQNLIVIEVPEDLAYGDYDYRITTDTDCVDPRVNVEN